MNTFEPKTNHDVRWLAHLEDTIRRFEDHGGAPTSGPLGDWLRRQRIEYKKRTMNAVRAEVLDRVLPVGWLDGFTYSSDHAWESKFNEILSAKALTRRLPTTGPLYLWLERQRMQKRSGHLKPERRELLDAQVPGWERSKHCEAWENKFNVLVSLYSSKPELPTTGPLYVWLRYQRSLKHAGRLKPERRQLLDAQLPGWERAPAPTSGAWENKFNELVSLHSSTLNWPTTGSLYIWLSKQRWLDRSGRLKPERRQLLDAQLPGWERSRSSDAWDNRFQELVSSYSSTGVWPQPGPLLTWLKGQRKLDRADRLNPERRKRFDSRLPGWNDVRVFQTQTHDLAWESSLIQLCDFVKKNNSFPKRDVPLGLWLNQQRRFLRDGSLSSERKAALDTALPGWSNTQRHLWDVRLEELSLIEHPQRIPTTSTLGNWLSKQRWHLINGSITPNRVALLDDAWPDWVLGRVEVKKSVAVDLVSQSMSTGNEL
ncbi:helicase associated domain-containing protein [Lysinibacter cavernae]|uniref:helicase associated domain-containing protein n=1 Tax=Lysinibacter cavernae TaxID=1640652 RepID=UPI0036223662